MEYIDGEDLASLLKRVGYLSNEKALDVARQLAAGLAAAQTALGGRPFLDGAAITD